MQIEIMRNIAGRSQDAKGRDVYFGYDPGMKIEVEDERADRWIAAGIAKKPDQMDAPAVLEMGVVPEVAVKVPKETTQGRKGRQQGRRS